MNIHTFSTPKAGIEDFQNEDAVYIHSVHENGIVVLMSDGASTGVFSKEWSGHLTREFDISGLKSPDEFEAELTRLRESFKPEIKRPTRRVGLFIYGWMVGRFWNGLSGVGGKNSTA